MAKGKTGEELHLTPLELIDRIAALIPPPRTHRHRYFGVLAPNSPHRAAVTEMAQSIAVQTVQTVQTAQPLEVRSEPANTGAGEGALGVSDPLPTLAEPAQPAQPVQPKRPAHYLWAVLMARIYEVFPLLCSLCGLCGDQMRIIAFITHSADIRHILEHITGAYRGRDRAPAHHPGTRAAAVG